MTDKAPASPTRTRRTVGAKRKEKAAPAVESVLAETRGIEEIMEEVRSNPPNWVCISGGRLSHPRVQFEALVRKHPDADIPFLTKALGKRSNVVNEMFLVRNAPGALEPAHAKSDDKSVMNALKEEMDAAVIGRELVAGEDVAQKLVRPFLALNKGLESTYGTVSAQHPELTVEERIWMGSALEKAQRSVSEKYREYAPKRTRPKTPLPVPETEKARTPAERAQFAKFNKELVVLRGKAKAHYLGKELNLHSDAAERAMDDSLSELRKEARRKLNGAYPTLERELSNLRIAMSLPRFKETNPLMGEDLLYMLGNPRKLIGSRLKGVATSKRQDIRDWAHKEIRVAEGRPAPASLMRIKYQDDMLSVLASDDALPRRVYVRKSSRVGYTTALICLMQFNIVSRKLPQAIFFPTMLLTKRFQQTFWQPSVDNSPLAEMVEKDRELKSDKRKSDVQNRDIQSYGGIPVHFLASRSATHLSQFTAPVVIVDETDECFVEGADSVDFHAESQRATRGLPYARIIEGGTPANREDKKGIVDKAENASHAFHYEVPCHECGEYQQLVWDTKPDRKAGFEWKARDKETAVTDKEIFERAETTVYRGTCGHVWTWGDYRAQESKGRWTTKEGHVLDCSKRLPRIFDSKGKPVRMASSLSFSIWSAYSVTQPWSEMIEQWLLAQTDRKLLATFHRTFLGLDWNDLERELHPDEIAARKCVSKVPSWADTATAGVDVQDQSIHIGVFAYGGKDRVRVCLLAHKVFEGDSTEDQLDPSWTGLAEYLNAGPEWEREDGRKLKIDGLFIDSGFRPDRVREALKDLVRRPSRKAPVKGADPVTSTRTTNDRLVKREAKARGEMRGYIVDVFQMKKLLFSKMMDKKENETFVWLGGKETGISRTTFDELASEKMEYVKVGSSGRRRLSFVKKPGTRNEMLDTFVYSYGCMVWLRPPFMRTTAHDALSARELHKRMRDDLFHEEQPESTQKHDAAYSSHLVDTSAIMGKKTGKTSVNEKAALLAENLASYFRRKNLVIEPVKVQEQPTDISGWVERPEPETEPEEVPVKEVETTLEDSGLDFSF